MARRRGRGALTFSASPLRVKFTEFTVLFHPNILQFDDLANGPCLISEFSCLAASEPFIYQLGGANPCRLGMLLDLRVKEELKSSHVLLFQK